MRVTSGSELWLLRLMAERGLRLLDASDVMIVMRRGPALEIVAHAGNAQPRARTLPLSTTTMGVLYGKQPALVLERPTVREAPWLGELGLNPLAVLVEPVPFDDEPGLLLVFRATEPPFGGQDRAAAKALARSVSERAQAERSAERERLRHGVQARELERARWARELHDETVQSLGALRLLLAGARDQHDARELQRAIEDALDRVDHEVEALRHLITALRPAALDDLGLVAALKALARRAEAIDGIPVRTEIALDGEVPGLRPKWRTRSTGSPKRRLPTPPSTPAPLMRAWSCNSSTTA